MITEEKAIEQGYTLLSYSAINSLLDCNQFWVNKQLCLDEIDFEWFKSGREAHRIIQDHVSGTKENDTLIKFGITGDDYKFEIVEEEDFDQRTKFTYEIEGKYLLRGYADGLSKDKKRRLEIKTPVWSFKQYIDSMQRKIYALGFNSEESVLITTDKVFSKVKGYFVPDTEKDKQEALEWVQQAIDVIERGSFDEIKKPFCPRCIFRDSCEKRCI